MHSVYNLFAANAAPSLTAPNLIRVVLNEATTIPVNVSDTDGDNVTVTVDVSVISDSFTARKPTKLLESNDFSRIRLSFCPKGSFNPSPPENVRTCSL